MRYYPSNYQLDIFDNDYMNRDDGMNFTGIYPLYYQEMEKYPEGSIIFTRGKIAFYQSVVMIPYVDGSADFIVDETTTYHCDSFVQAENEFGVPVRIYQWIVTVRNIFYIHRLEATRHRRFCNLDGVLNYIVGACIYADSTKYGEAVK